MSKYLDHAKQLRATVEPHYNCGQSVLVPFAKDAGITEETAYAITANFGRGLRRAAACGAITGGIVALGLFGIDDAATITAYYRKLREHHDGKLECADLLRQVKEQGADQRAHCDGLVYECVSLVESILRDKGKI